MLPIAASRIEGVSIPPGLVEVREFACSLLRRTFCSYSHIPLLLPSQLHGSRGLAFHPVSSKFASLLAHSSSFSDFFSFCFLTSDSNVPHPLAHTSRGARPRDALHTQLHSPGEGQAHSRRTHPQDRTDTPHRRTPPTPRHPGPQRSTQTGKITNGACPDPLSLSFVRP